MHGRAIGLGHSGKKKAVVVFWLSCLTEYFLELPWMLFTLEQELMAPKERHGFWKVGLKVVTTRLFKCSKLEICK